MLLLSPLLTVERRWELHAKLYLGYLGHLGSESTNGDKHMLTKNLQTICILVFFWANHLSVFSQTLSETVPLPQGQPICAAVAGTCIYVLPDQKGKVARVLKYDQNTSSTVPLIEQSAGVEDQLLAMFGTISGDLFFAYNQRSWTQPPTAHIARLSPTGQGVEQVISNDSLFPRAFAVGVNRYFIAGMTRDQEKLVVPPKDLKGTVSVTLLHVLDQQGQEIRSIYTIPVSAHNAPHLLPLLHRVQISVRHNGNFFVIFDPVSASVAGWTDLIGPSVVEYSPNGLQFKVHEFAAAPTKSVVGSIVEDIDGGLIVQFVDVNIRRQDAIAAFGWRSTVLKFLTVDPASAKPIMEQLPQGERLLASMSDGRIVTEAIGQGLLHVWTR